MVIFCGRNISGAVEDNLFSFFIWGFMVSISRGVWENLGSYSLGA